MAAKNKRSNLNILVKALQLHLRVRVVGKTPLVADKWEFICNHRLPMPTYPET